MRSLFLIAENRNGMGNNRDQPVKHYMDGHERYCTNCNQTALTSQ